MYYLGQRRYPYDITKRQTDTEKPLPDTAFVNKLVDTSCHIIELSFFFSFLNLSLTYSLFEELYNFASLATFLYIIDCLIFLIKFLLLIQKFTKITHYENK